VQASAASEGVEGSLPDDTWADDIPRRADVDSSDNITPAAAVELPSVAGGSRPRAPFAVGDHFRAASGVFAGAEGIVV